MRRSAPYESAFEGGRRRVGAVRVLIVAVGTSGDVAPFTGLGARLREAGHEVTIAAHGPFEEFVRVRGLGFAALPMDMKAELSTEEGRRSLTSSPAMVVRQTRIYARHWAAMADAIVDAAEGAEFMLVSTMGWLGIHVAEGLRIPSMGVYLQPMDPTREFPPAVMTTRSLGGWGNRAAARSMRVLGQAPFRSVVNGLRERLDLPPVTPARFFRRLDERGWPVEYGFSPTVVPRPADWPRGREVAGYWWPEPAPDWRPPEALSQFLDDGPSPVFVGFGSLTAGDQERYGAMVTEALRIAGVRGVVQAGWSGLAADEGSKDVLAVGEVPHDWLFPRMAAVVHSCGAGTTAAGLRAGVPSVGVPLSADQPFWAKRVAALGAGPEPVPFRRLDAGRLASAIRDAVSRDSYRERAQAVAEQIAAEDGAAHVLRAIESRAS
ncbi:nucleotide disphospho-sugar-binding domain-containing protein [Actinomadura sp. NPDC000600]|uniref:glycosyltransferase n=1 Tax=Actinomadura sp. NPDC000600 TaxID=3154262 RepID=UPI0033950E3B